MNFKDILEKDLDIFLNTEEFAEEINLDSVQLKAIVSSVISEENKFKLGIQGAYGYGQAIYINQKEITFKSSDINFNYKKGDQVDFNGFLYEVISVEEDLKMTTLTIGEQGN